MATKQEMKEKLESIINRGRASASGVVERIMREVPTDRIIKGSVLDFRPDDRGVFMHVENKASGLAVGPDKSGAGINMDNRLHPNARTQVLERAQIPAEFATRLEARPWGRELLAENLRKVYQNGHASERYLVRSHATEVRGFLSNKFRRLDSRPIIDSLVNASKKVGAEPYEGIASDTRYALTLVLPTVYDVTGKGEYGVFGLSWQNSDYGNGAHNLRAFFLRLLCVNGMTTSEQLREVHLGARLESDDIWSAKTLDFDTKRSASMVSDAVRAYLSPHKLETEMALIKQASEKEIDPKKIQETLKKALGAGTAKRVFETYNSPDVENLPPGNSSWRLSNAISWLAGKETDADEKMKLMKVAGDVVMAAA